MRAKHSQWLAPNKAFCRPSVRDISWHLLQQALDKSDVLWSTTPKRIPKLGSRKLVSCPSWICPVGRKTSCLTNGMAKVRSTSRQTSWFVVVRVTLRFFCYCNYSVTAVVVFVVLTLVSFTVVVAVIVGLLLLLLSSSFLFFAVAVFVGVVVTVFCSRCNSLRFKKFKFSQPFKVKCVSKLEKLYSLIILFIWVRYELPSSPYCVV